MKHRFEGELCTVVFNPDFSELVVMTSKEPKYNEQRWVIPARYLVEFFRHLQRSHYLLPQELPINTGNRDDNKPTTTHYLHTGAPVPPDHIVAKALRDGALLGTMVIDGTGDEIDGAAVKRAVGLLLMGDTPTNYLRRQIERLELESKSGRMDPAKAALAIGELAERLHRMEGKA